jgi:hypothetical protein
MTTALLLAALNLSGHLTPWRQDCTNGCALPQGAGKAETVAVAVDTPMNPGEARVAKFEKELSYGGAGERVRASATVYFVCPRSAKPIPGQDSCPTRYLQVQIVLSGDAKAFCAAALNPADAAPFPVMMCAGENLRRPGERLGVSLSREELTSAEALLGRP